jgi:hypothetical protein
VDCSQPQVYIDSINIDALFIICYFERTDLVFQISHELRLKLARINPKNPHILLAGTIEDFIKYTNAWLDYCIKANLISK